MKSMEETANAASSPAALEACAVSKRLGGRLVLSRLDLTMQPGSMYALMGENGAGKTTLLQCLSAQTQFTAGEVRWFGQSPARNVSLRRLVGLVFHETGLYPELSARENLLFAARMQQLGDAARRVNEVLEEAQLRHYADWQASRLSKGIRQRLALLRSWLHEPRLLLLDEPFAALDDAGAAWLMQQLRTRRAGGCTILFSCHDQALAKQLADRIVQLDRGRLVEAEDADDASDEPRRLPFGRAWKQTTAAAVRGCA